MKDCPHIASCPYYQHEKDCMSSVGKILTQSYCHGSRQSKCERLKLLAQTGEQPPIEVGPDKNHNYYSRLYQEGMELKIAECMKALKRNGFSCSYYDNRQEAVEFLLSECQSAESISHGGSMTLEEIGLFRQLEEQEYPFFNYSTPENRLRSLTVDLYLTSSNAVTVDGKLVNIDGTGNRVAALCFGPKKIFVIVGTNKIVSTEEEGIKRIREVAAPLNAMRLQRKVPCVITGNCVDCDSPERICRSTVITGYPIPGRIHVVLIDEMLGY